MDTIFIASQKGKTSDLHIDLKRYDKYIALSNLSIHYT